MLASQAGKALTDYLRSNNERLLLPFVVSEELRRNNAKRVSEIDNKLLQLAHERRQILGEPWDSYTAMTSTSEDVVMRARYDFEDLLIRVGEDDRAKVRAADRVIAGRLPNTEKNQQYKDSLLWEELLSFDSERIDLITSDKVFYESQDFRKGLASELKQDLPETKWIFACQGIAEYLAEKKWAPVPSDDRLYGRLAHNLLFFLGDQAMRELEAKHGVKFLQMSPAESSYRLLRAGETLSMQLQGWCAPIVERPDGTSHQLQLDVAGEAVISDGRFLSESILLKEWRLHQGGYIEGGLSSR